MMPWKVEKRGSGWVTINADTGRVRGRHATRAKAEAQRQLLEMIRHGGRKRKR
jgi:hypothetical protein